MPQELDCRGLPCPEPVLRTRRMITNSGDDAVSVLVDNPTSMENVRRFLENNGFTTAVQQEKDNLWRIAATRTGAAPAARPAATAETCEAAACRAHRTLVFISTDTLGRGNDELGARLMENFLSTLPELGSRLWRIVLVNSGVKLAAYEGKALASLKALEAAGVSILVCGTCLDFYELKAKKQIGETTNMLDIVTSLDLADKVLRP